MRQTGTDARREGCAKQGNVVGVVWVCGQETASRPYHLGCIGEDNGSRHVGCAEEELRLVILEEGRVAPALLLPPVRVCV